MSFGPLQGLGVLSSSDRSALKRRIKDIQTAAEKERKALEKLEKQKEKQRRRDQEQHRNWGPPPGGARGNTSGGPEVLSMQTDFCHYNRQSAFGHLEHLECPQLEKSWQTPGVNEKSKEKKNTISLRHEDMKRSENFETFQTVFI